MIQIRFNGCFLSSQADKSTPQCFQVYSTIFSIFKTKSAEEYNQWVQDVKDWVAETNDEYERIKDKYGIDVNVLDAIADTLVDE